MYKLVLTFLILIFFINKPFNAEEKEILSKKKIFFDSVEKQLIFLNVDDKIFKSYFQKFFDNNIKLDGFEGLVKFEINNFKIENLKIKNKDEITISYDLNIYQKFENKSKTNKISVKEFGIIEGYYSRSQVDDLYISVIIKSINNIIDYFS